jgi:hypothetical protein
VAGIPRASRRALRAAGEGLDYLTVHRRRGPLGIRPGPARTEAGAAGATDDEGGDPACWAHLFEDDDPPRFTG